MSATRTQMNIDWQSLAEKLQSGNRGGTELARRALIEIIGEEAISASVDHYIDLRDGSELARSVLWLLRPEAARRRCLEIYQNDSDLERRQMAIELLRVLATRDTLPWVSTFLTDPDPTIQNWGAGVVDQLLWSELVVPAECAALLHTMKTHPSASVRERYEFVQGFLNDRALLAAQNDKGEQAVPPTTE